MWIVQGRPWTIHIGSATLTPALDNPHRLCNSHCVARIQGPCMAIPNVALSKDFKKNLASVSQLTKAHGDQISFDQHHVYAGQSIPPGSQPAGTSIVGHATSSGLYHMDMDAYQRHVAYLKN